MSRESRSRGSKAYLIVLTTVTIALFAAVVVLSVFLAKNNNQNESSNNDTSLGNNQQEKVCYSKECIKAAHAILDNMDMSADPCNDFNQFTCGSFIKNRRIPDDASDTSSFTDLRTALTNAVSDALSSYTSNDIEATTNAKNFYFSCLDETDIEQNSVQSLFGEINKIGNWKLIYGGNIDPINFFNKVISLGKLNSEGFFDLYITQSPKNQTLNILRLQQPNWFLTKQKYDDSTIFPAYMKFTKTVVKLLLEEFSIDFDEKKEKEVESMIDMEKKIANFQLTQNEKRNQKFKFVTVKELNSLFPGTFDWERFMSINGFFADFPQINVQKDEVVVIEDSNYLTNFSKIYTNAVDAISPTGRDDLMALDNLLVWSFVKSKMNFLPKAFRDAQLEFDKVNIGTNSIPPRSRICANAVTEKMPMAVGKLYVDSNFDAESKNAAIDMIANIRAEFKIMLKANTWMDNESKKPADEKADAMDIKIGYPDYFSNATYLNILYNGYSFSKKNYIENYFTAVRAEVAKSFSELRKPFDTKDWITGPAIVNAFYSETNNQITFPAGILQTPFYDSRVPNYLNYGGIGMVIGHEITHGFDDQGRKYDKDGVFFDDGEIGLWSQKTIENYNERAKCIIEQYSNYVAKQVGKNLIGSQTQGENIADNGGIKESFYAYRRWAAQNGPEPLLPGLQKFTQEQMFFINFGQIWCSKITDKALESRIETGVHSPGEFRIIGTSSNFEEFSKAFQCSRGQNNDPVKKCSVW